MAFIKSERARGALYDAIRKYGPESFSVRTLVVHSDWPWLLAIEKVSIEKLGTLAPNGYNISPGGIGGHGSTRPETRVKQSIAQRKRFENPHQREHLRQATKAFFSKADNWERHRRTCKSIPATPLTRSKMSAAQKALRQDPQYAAARNADLAKAVEVSRQKWWMRSPEERKAWGEWHGKLVSAAHSTSEARAASSLRTKALWQTPEFRKKNMANRRTQGHYPRSDEWKRNMAEKRKREWADPIMRQKRITGFALARKQRQNQSR